MALERKFASASVDVHPYTPPLYFHCTSVQSAIRTRYELCQQPAGSSSPRVELERRRQHQRRSQKLLAKLPASTTTFHPHLKSAEGRRDQQQA